jgi:hypothetical protein
MRRECGCNPPVSITNVTNTSLASSQIGHDVLTVAANLTVTLSALAGDPILLLFLDGVPQYEGVNFTVDYDTGIITLIGATAGQTVFCLYVIAEAT